MTHRAAAVAGRFYSGQSAQLLRELEGYLPPATPKIKALGVVCPHAGYMYSGHTAGQVYSRIEIPAHVLLLGPNHTGRGAQLSLYPEGKWTTPLGSVAVDGAFNRLLLKHCPALREDTDAHTFEHCLEVQLPFLQYLKKNFSISAVCVGTGDTYRLVELGKAVAAAIRAHGKNTLIVASSDMTHYEPAENARQKDFRALEKIERLDPLGLADTVQNHDISMCGWAPTVSMLIAARELGATQAKLVSYTHSGMATGNDSDVVAYAGVVVS